jgi:hypothetical protein
METATIIVIFVSLLFRITTYSVTGLDPLQKIFDPFEEHEDKKNKTI